MREFLKPVPSKMNNKKKITEIMNEGDVYETSKTGSTI